MFDRRTFLKSGAAVITMATGGLSPLRLAFAQNTGRIVVNVMLIGGADFRQLFAPDPNLQPDYATAYWQARAPLTGQRGDLDTYRSVFSSEYTALAVNGVGFGVHQKAGWLIDRLRNGKAAVVANVIGSANRSHSHSQLIWHTGDPDASEYDYERDGWGGRLAYAIAGANVVSVAPTFTVFSQGTEASNRNARVIQATEPRQFALDESNSGPVGGLVSKSLTAYYAAKQQDVAAMPPAWPFHRILGHERKLRQLGQALNARLAQVTRPESLRLLYEGGSTLGDPAFGRQCAALFDCAVAGEVLGMRIAYMEHGNWDTHVNQSNRLSSNISDVFGTGKGLATLSSELAKRSLDGRIVYVITSDFGRQLAANTQKGTDHGSGSYSIVIGDGVRGGIFGEMFPASEIAGGPGSRPYDLHGAEIIGLTSFERVLGEVCDWVEPGSGDIVFPGRETSVVEAGVDLSRMFS